MLRVFDKKVLRVIFETSREDVRDGWRKRHNESIHTNGVYLLSNTTVWWIDIYNIYYIDNNYMLRRLVMIIFRLYMNT